MKKFLILITIVAVVSCTAFSVGAETFGTNDFFDFNDYSKYDYDGSLVKVTTVLPDWYITRDMGGGGTYYGKNVSFESYVYYDIYILGCPFGLNPTGADVTNGHLFDLFKMPSSFVLTNEFHLTQKFISGANWMPSTPKWMYFYVDVDGNVLETGYLPNTYAMEDLVDGYLTYDIEFEFSTDDYPIPELARGLYFAFEYKNEAFDGTYTFNISYEPFVITFDIDDPNFNMREDISSIRQNLEDIANGKVDPEKPADSDKFDDLKENEDKLIGDVENYLNEGVGFFDNAVGAIFNFANGFQAIKVLMIPVFNLPMFGDIILVSVSLGLIGTLLGVVTIVTSSINKKSDGKSKSKGSSPKGGKVK